MPGLMIGAAWSGSGCAYTGFDHAALYWFVGKLANRMPGADIFQKLIGALAHVFIGNSPAIRHWKGRIDKG